MHSVLLTDISKNHVKIISKRNDTCISQKTPGCKISVVLYKMASVKKSCEIKGDSQEMAVMV